MSSVVRIGNAQGFWGDRGSAAAELLAREPDLDYLTLDYLAEVSLSIMAVQRDRDPNAGYARDFIEVVRSLADYFKNGGRCRIVTNAGGLNPQGCAAACVAVLAQAGCPPLNIAVVSGDDVLELLRSTETEGSAECTAQSAKCKFENLDSGHPLATVRDRLVTANAYVGAAPIVEALRLRADIVITGRTADPSLTVAPCVHHFGWSLTDWDRLAGATVAGHLIECGVQVTGGISTDWLEMPDSADLSFPIVEVADDGSCVVTKPADTGGCVDERTVKEQLVYEIGNPDEYLSPDVSVSFQSLTVADLGSDRVRVSGARGRPAPKMLKVSATHRDGFRAAGTLTIFGRDAVTKARRAGEIVLQRVRNAGFELRDSFIECLGTGASVPAVPSRIDESQFLETVLRIAVEANDRAAVECFARELMPLVTAGPQGTTGYAEGRPHPHPVFRYWPCLIERDLVHPKVELVSETSRRLGPAQRRPTSMDSNGEPALRWSHSTERPQRLADLAYARSGDKGTGANIGVVARSPEGYDLLLARLTAECVGEFFASMGVTEVTRYELPNLHALNFVVKGILSRPLRVDAQGKALGQALLEMPWPGDQP
ncbi:MAG: DUF1446 domain-containing protein [Planctomycetes bacterium]|nr:DUF1446 domain-containing protein [Planctomycetota bacterium]